MTDPSSPESAGTEAPLASSPREQALFAERLRFLNQPECLTFPRDAITSDVLAAMRQARAGGVLITAPDDKSSLAGIFTERDYLDKLNGRFESQSKPIETFMTPAPHVLDLDATVGEAIRLMTEGGYRHVPLVNSDGAVAGMVSVRNIVDYVSEHFAEAVFNHPPELHQRMSTQEGG